MARRSYRNSPYYNPYYNQDRYSITTAGFSPTVVTPLEFQPVEANIGILADSLAKQEARQREAMEQQTAIDATLAKIEASLHNDPATQAWFNNYKNDIKQQINNYSQVGDYAGAINSAIRLAGKVADDSAVIGRLRANEEYQQKVDEVHKRAIAKDISRDTERWWLANNQYDYKDTYDANGNVIGGTSYSTLDVPVHDINIDDFTKKAFDLITPHQTNVWTVDSDGTGHHETSQWVSRQQIIDNLNEILDMTPDARAAMYQRYQVELNNYNELLNDANSDPIRVKQQRNLLQKNGSDVSFEDFCVRMIEQSAISQNLAYYIGTSKDDNKPKTPRSDSGSGANGLTPPMPVQSITGDKYEFTSYKNSASNAGSYGNNANKFMK